MIILCYLLFVIFSSQSVNYASPVIQTVSPLRPQPLGITITSFRFNGGVGGYIEPAWLNTTFLDYSIWYDKKYYWNPSGIRFVDGNELTSLELARRRVRLPFDLPPYAWYPKVPSCSIELLGFARIGKTGPFSNKTMYEHPGYGKANLTFPVQLNGNDEKFRSKKTTWMCVYRTIYENWRSMTPQAGPHYMGTIFYCPGPSVSSCNKNVGVSSQNFSLRVQLEDNVVWSTIFVGHFFYSTVSRDRISSNGGGGDGDVSISISNSNNNNNRNKSSRSRGKSNVNVSTSIDFDSVIQHEINEKKNHFMNNTAVNPIKSLNMAVCTAIPYSTYDIDKIKANRAMIIEWMHYYVKLGFKVIIFDRDGVNRKIMRSDHSHALSLKINISNFDDGHQSHPHDEGHPSHPRRYSDMIHYRDFTIKGVLDPSSQNVRYDNSEVDRRDFNSSIKSRHEAQGNDKVYTLTQCRFEAKTMFGIDDVLVIDFDEFLYCKGAGKGSQSAKIQREYIRQQVRKWKETGLQQVMIQQRVVGNKTDDINHCVIQQVKRGKSVFSCFAAFDYYISSHSIKSFHLGHICPFTGYHQSCPHPSVPRAYNCMCRNFEVKATECCLLHLSTRQRYYNEDDAEAMEPQRIAAMKRSQSELIGLSYGERSSQEIKKISDLAV